MNKASTVKAFGSKVSRVEGRVGKAFAKHEGTPAMRFLSAFGDLGDQPQLRLISGGLVAGGLLTANGRLVRAGVRMLFAHELTTKLKSAIKHRVDRTRPRSAEQPSERKVKLGKSRAKEETSFPSGHSAGAIAVARAFSREYPEHQATALAAAGSVAAAQVPRCAHYPTDVAAGVMLGLVSEAIANGLIGLGNQLLGKATPEEQRQLPIRA
jgi:membrane-associated phospholipid phosphatase